MILLKQLAQTYPEVFLKILNLVRIFLPRRTPIALMRKL